MNALLIDFGSTFTKLRAVALDPVRILGSGQGPSTVLSDVSEGMHAALVDLKSKLGGLPAFDHRLACSSAAGGLRMVTVGLVRELTAEAARQAALGAGARLVGAFAQRLTKKDIAEIKRLAPDILLLAGGTDGGNSEVILHNARALAADRLDCPFVVAGNRAAADEVAATLGKSAPSVLVSENVMPEFGQLNVEPARDAIRQIYIERIVHAKGIDRAATQFDQVLMPTPAAVLEGARILSEGAAGETGLRPLMVVDVGGATTDVHSVAGGEPVESGTVQRGLPEPYLKRTVEGDLGMRANARGILLEAGSESLAAAAGVDASLVEDFVEQVSNNPDRLPEDDEERRVDFALAQAAVHVAVRRHAGTIETVYSVNGPVTVQRGKDLRALGCVIGTGGVLAHGEAATDILRASLAKADEPLSLRPQRPRLMLDKEYMLYAVGLLASVAPEAAVRLGKAQLEAAEEESNHGRNTVARG